MGAVLTLQAGFVRIELGVTQILIWYKSLSKIRWTACYHVAYHYRATRVMLQVFSPRRGRGVVLRVSHWLRYGLKMGL